MKNKIPLTIALTATMSLSAAFAADTSSSSNDQTATEASVASPLAQGEGKCASGKCGSLKKFGVVEVDADKQDGKLVRVRDGNCGTKTNKIYSKKGKKEIPQLGKCSSGVCGR